MIAASEVLVAAVHLTELPGIARCTEGAAVSYVHLMFDRHEVIFAERAPTESLYLGPMARRGIPASALCEIVEIFPELADAQRRPEPARPLLRGRQARRLAACHRDAAAPLIA